jgi:hypothetical protein
MTADLLDDLAKRFAFHTTIYGTPVRENASPLYAHLSQYVSTDRDILELVLNAKLPLQHLVVIFPFLFGLGEWGHFEN